MVRCLGIATSSVVSLWVYVLAAVESYVDPYAAAMNHLAALDLDTVCYAAFDGRLGFPCLSCTGGVMKGGEGKGGMGIQQVINTWAAILSFRAFVAEPYC